MSDDKPQEDMLWLGTHTFLELQKCADSMPEPKRILGPLQTGTWGFIAAEPGVGKSMFALKIAHCITTGADLGDWPSGGKEQVLLVDAELSPKELHSRMKPFGAWPEAGMFIHHQQIADDRLQRPFSLSSWESHERLMQDADDVKARVIIIDNVEFTLDPVEGKDIWHPETWDQVRPLLHWAVLTNRLLILIDHTNAAGKVQGTSAKNKGARFTIFLDPLETEADVSFTCRIGKIRYLVPKELRHEFEARAFGAQWEFIRSLSMKEQVEEYVFAGGYTNKDIAEETGITIRQVQRIKRQLGVK